MSTMSVWVIPLVDAGELLQVLLHIHGQSQCATTHNEDGRGQLVPVIEQEHHLKLVWVLDGVGVPQFQSKVQFGVVAIIIIEIYWGKRTYGTDIYVLLPCQYSPTFQENLSNRSH